MALAASPFLAILCPSIIEAAVVLLPGIPVSNDVYESAVEDEAITLMRNTSPEYGMPSNYGAKEKTNSMAVPAPAIGITPRKIPYTVPIRHHRTYSMPLLVSYFNNSGLNSAFQPNIVLNHQVRSFSFFSV